MNSWIKNSPYELSIMVHKDSFEGFWFQIFIDVLSRNPKDISLWVGIELVRGHLIADLTTVSVLELSVERNMVVSLLPKIPKDPATKTWLYLTFINLIACSSGKRMLFWCQRIWWSFWWPKMLIAGTVDNKEDSGGGTAVSVAKDVTSFFTVHNECIGAKYVGAVAKNDAQIIVQGSIPSMTQMLS